MEKYIIVKKYIDEMDYCSLLSFGASDDEFDTESPKISGMISHSQTEQDTAWVIAEVFNRAFDRQDKAYQFMDCVKRYGQICIYNF